MTAHFCCDGMQGAIYHYQGEGSVAMSIDCQREMGTMSSVTDRQLEEASEEDRKKQLR